jgi:bifunctional UDP-N-acetylglucosamine pyrophosphorylase/glucosamine-1-phosphate N-acetyltransferase
MSHAESGTRPVAAVILAAGKGTRMKSRKAKILHDLCGRPMLGHMLASAVVLEPERLLVVVGHEADLVAEIFAGRAEFVIQAEQRGTGHAVLQAQPKLEGFEGDVLILYGDTPLLRSETLERMIALKRESGADLLLLSALLPLPGRVVRDSAGRVERIVETTDASEEELTIEEGNTGVYLIDSKLLREGLASLRDDNEQGELYITDVVGFAVAEGRSVEALLLEDAEECLGINTRAELAEAAAVLRRRTNQRLMAKGVSIVDPANTYIDVDVEIGQDSLIEPGCVIQGESVLGEGVHLKPHCVVESSELDDGVVIGPSAHLRPGTRLREGVRVGNFVEVKNSDLGPGSKADHLSYIGDSDVGAGSSFGCGSITVNYDGIAKHRTTLGDGVFVGCNANLIAPLTLGSGSFIAAGSTITQDVSSDALGVARAKQREIAGWSLRRKAASGRAARKPKESSESSQSGKTSDESSEGSGS